jgi:hypothetical protein
MKSLACLPALILGCACTACASTPPSAAPTHTVNFRVSGGTADTPYEGVARGGWPIDRDAVDRAYAELGARLCGGPARYRFGPLVRRYGAASDGSDATYHAFGTLRCG